MEKLKKGIIQFRKDVQQKDLDHYSKLAIGQKPDALFVACSDSRVVPNIFASTDPGDLFVLRNVGNIIPPFNSSNVDTSAIAAIEYSVLELKIKDIIICGHSECGAMNALLNNTTSPSSNLHNWIGYAKRSKELLFSKRFTPMDPELSKVNQLSQINTVQQIEHLKTYSVIAEHIADGRLRVHAWWFDIATAYTYIYDEKKKIFEKICE
jgi:carbonic anhydrase